MRCMRRNKVKFYYALFDKKEPVRDEYGNLTGEYEITHTKPEVFYANISSAKGEIQTQQFGENETYDKVLVTEINVLPIDEYSILWIDTIPELDEDGNLLVNDKNAVITPHDYIVKKVAKSLNSISIAISKVNVSG